MDKSIPAAAALILDFIGATEAPLGYGTVYGNNQKRLKKPLTAMTLNAVISAQRDWSRRFGSSAAGRYQFMRNTLIGLKKEMRLTGAELMTADFQDRLGFRLLLRRGYDEFMSGRISRTAFGLSLAKEWASFPVLAATKGAHRDVKRGQSYYAGDGVNKSLVQPAAVEAVLELARKKPADAPKPAEAPKPVPKPQAPPAPAPAGKEKEIRPVPVEVPGLDKPLGQSTTVWGAIGAFLMTVLAAVKDFLAQLAELSPAVQLVLVGAIVLIAAVAAVWIIAERRKYRDAQRAYVAGVRAAD